MSKTTFLLLERADPADAWHLIMLWVFPAASSTPSCKYYPALCHVSISVAPSCGKFIYQITHFLAIKNQLKPMKRWLQENYTEPTDCTASQTSFILLVSVCHLSLLTHSHQNPLPLLHTLKRVNNHQSHGLTERSANLAKNSMKVDSGQPYFISLVCF